MKILLVILILLLCTAFAVPVCFTSHIASTQDATFFIIEKPFIEIFKKLANKNSLEKIIQQNNDTLVDKNWEYLNVEIIRILKPKSWTINGKMNFTVDTNNDFKTRLHFNQFVDYSQGMLKIITKLETPDKNILICEKTIQIIDQINNTKVNVKTTLVVKKYIPKYFVKLMDDKVKEHNLKDIQKIKDNLINITKNKDALISIPIQKINYELQHVSPVTGLYIIEPTW